MKIYAYCLNIEQGIALGNPPDALRVKCEKRSTILGWLFGRNPSRFRYWGGLFTKSVSASLTHGASLRRRVARQQFEVGRNLQRVDLECSHCGVTHSST